MAISATQLLKNVTQSKRKVLIACCVFLVLAAAVTAVFLSRTSQNDSSELRQNIAQMEKAVKSDPHNADLRVALALGYYQADSLQQAISQLKTALDFNQNHQSALMLLGDIYMNLKRYPEAQACYQKLVELNPIEQMTFSSRQIEGAYYQLGAANYNMGNWTGAAAVLESTLIIDNSDSDAWYLLGKSYQKLEQFEKAVECFRKTVRYVPNYKEAYQSMGECFEKLGQDVYARYAKAMVAYSSGSTQEALTQLQIITAEKPDYTDAVLGLALAYEKAGDTDKAKAAYEKVLELDPEDWLAKAKLGR